MMAPPRPPTDAGVLARRHVERDDEAGLLEQRPHVLERRIVVLELARLGRAVGRGVAEADAAEAVLGGPLDLPHGALLVARRDQRHRQHLGLVAQHVGAHLVDHPAVPRRAHRHGEAAGRAWPSTAGRRWGTRSRRRRRRPPGRRGAARRCGRRPPAAGPRPPCATSESRLCSGRSNVCCSCTVDPCGGFTICGRLPSVMRNSAPSSRTSKWGMRSR